jgi:hypothetical protein
MHAEPKAKRGMVTCPCGVVFPFSGNQFYCSPECRHRHSAKVRNVYRLGLEPANSESWAQRVKVLVAHLTEHGAQSIPRLIAAMSRLHRWPAVAVTNTLAHGEGLWFRYDSGAWGLSVWAQNHRAA